MSRLLAESPEAAAWVEQAKAALGREGVFGRIGGAVIWSDVTGRDGEQIVPIDPYALVANINANSFPLLKGHDPGFPLGKVLAAEVFTSVADGTTFVAAVIGFYNGARLSFRDLGLDSIPAIASPARLPALPDACWINLATDPREIESQ
jgi:hypothetical protein